MLPAWKVAIKLAMFVYSVSALLARKMIRKRVNERNIPDERCDERPQTETAQTCGQEGTRRFLSSRNNTSAVLLIALLFVSYCLAMFTFPKWNLPHEEWQSFSHLYISIIRRGSGHSAIRPEKSTWNVDKISCLWSTTAALTERGVYFRGIWVIVPFAFATSLGLSMSVLMLVVLL